MPHKKLIVANWKMNKGLVQSQQFADELKLFTDKHKLTDTLVVLCPPFTSLDRRKQKDKRNAGETGRAEYVL